MNRPYGFYGGSFYIVGAIHESPAASTIDKLGTKASL